MEKKFIAIVIALAVMLGVSNESMSGMNDGSDGGYGGGVNFVDENGDGICDSLSRGDCAGYVDEDGEASVIRAEEVVTALDVALKETEEEAL